MKIFDIYLSNATTGKFKYDHHRWAQDSDDAVNKASAYFGKAGVNLEGREIKAWVTVGKSGTFRA